MRTPQEMMELILKTAEEDERIRAAWMNGSRANPDAPKDLFQDYDIVFVVRELHSFVKGHDYCNVFGEPLMVQMPETMRGPMGDGRFTYLALYQDGIRVDLQLLPAERWKELYESDSQTILLLDKDGILPRFPPASDSDYHIKPPSLNDYTSCCNDFWWCMQNVAKGIWRNELPYAMGMYHNYVREELHIMISWYIGIRHGFDRSAGKMGKYFKRYLAADEYARYCQTYSGSGYPEFWQAVFAMCGLFRDLARIVGGSFGFPYCEEDDRRMSAYLKRVQALPPDARSL